MDSACRRDGARRNRFRVRAHDRPYARLSFDLPDPFLQRIEAGEQFDVLISAAGPIDALIKETTARAGNRATFARSGVG